MKTLTVQEALTKELFREQLETHNVELYIIDRENEYRFPCCTGCYKAKNGKWTVYSVGPRQAVYNEAQYDRQSEAYRDMAKRVGFTYDAKWANGNVPLKKARFLLKCLKTENQGLKKLYTGYNLDEEVSLLENYVKSYLPEEEKMVLIANLVAYAHHKSRAQHFQLISISDYGTREPRQRFLHMRKNVGREGGLHI